MFMSAFNVKMDPSNWENNVQFMFGISYLIVILLMNTVYIPLYIYTQSYLLKCILVYFFSSCSSRRYGDN